jgi:ATP-dependent Zn protease
VTERSEIVGYKNKRNKHDLAYHEAGHAVMAWWLELPLLHASIIRQGESGGRVTVRPPMKLKSELPGIAKRHRLEAQICMFRLAGLVAEQMHDASQWIELGEEYREALNIIASIYSPFNPQGKGRRWRFLQNVIALTNSVLHENRDTLTRIADALKERGKLSGEEIYALMVSAAPNGAPISSHPRRTPTRPPPRQLKSPTANACQATPRLRPGKGG